MTLRDPNQILTAEHDEQNNAKRIIIVGGEMPEFKMSDFSKTLVEQSIKIEKIEVPVIVKEIEKIEVPIVIKEIEIKEVPILIKEVQIERIEVPVIVKEYQTIEATAQIKEIVHKESIPKWFMILMLVESIITILTILTKFYK